MPASRPLPATLVAGTALCAFAPTDAIAQVVVHEEEREPFPGLRILERHTENPKWRIHAALVDLCEDGVRVEARSPQQVKSTVPAWGEAMGVQLAINGDFFRGDELPTVYGDAVGVGQRWPAEQTGRGDHYEDEWYHENYGWIGFGPDLVEFAHTAWVKEHADELGVEDGFFPREVTTEIPDGTTALVSGFSQLVVEGNVLDEFPDRSDLSDRHPRTAMGLSEDRTTFILVAVDGRSLDSVGMRGDSLAALMHELGAYVAFNLDGGASTQMWLEGDGLINEPSANDPLRPVANHWGVVAGGDDEPNSCAPVSQGDGDGPGDGPGGAPDAGGGGDAGVGGASSGGAGCHAAGGAAGPNAAALIAILAAACRRARRPTRRQPDKAG